MITPAGWNTWDVRSLNAIVHLPSALRVRFSLLDTRNGEQCTEFDWRTGMQRLGPHATDGTYSQVDLKWNGAIVRVEYAARGSQLACRVTGLVDHTHLRLLVTLDGAWQVEVQSTRNAEGWQVTAGEQTWLARALGHTDAASGFALDVPLLVHVTPATLSGIMQSAKALASWIDQQRDAVLAAGLHTSGWLAEAADGLVRGINWNTIWEPIKGRICTPVSRDWCKGQFFGSYVLFDWDTFFCAVMASLEDPRLAEANVRAILQEVSANGFVPNFGCEFGASEDRSQPPVGAYCTLKVYQSAGLANHEKARALLDETYPAFKRWHAWWLPHRDGNGDGLLEWGSDPLPGLKEWLCDNMQAAMYESGLDNSPMYDDVIFNPQTHTMELADVGLNSLYALDAWALSRIASLLGRDEEARAYSDEHATLTQRINEQMWDEAAGIYKNKHWDGRLSPHLSPTNFYPLIAGIAPRERAERMLNEHLLNECEFAGQYMIPSTSRDDPGFGGNDYWRGRIWGPMNFLVSEGLRRYRFDDAALQFARRGLELFLGEWRAENHVHENYNSDSGDGDDVPNSDPVYTWGALLAYIAVQELVDAEAWGGWRFGNLDSETASVQGVSVAEGTLDVMCGPDGLDVRLNGALLLRTSQPVLVTEYRREQNALSLRVIGRGEVALTLGQLLPSASVMVGPVPYTTDAAGQLVLGASPSQSLVIRW
jgi:hypothetical protein